MRYDTMPRIAQESPKKGLFPLGSFKIVKITPYIKKSYTQKLLHFLVKQLHKMNYIKDDKICS